MKVPANYSNLVSNYVEYFQSSSDMKKVDLQKKQGKHMKTRNL